MAENGADPNHRVGEGVPLLTASIGRLSLKNAAYLILKGADINIPTQSFNPANSADQHTAFHSAAAFKRRDMLKLLFKMGADIHAFDRYGSAALHYLFQPYIAQNKAPHSCLKFLLKQGLDPNVRGIGGNAPLILAARRGDIKSIKFLLKYGAGRTLTNTIGQAA